MPELGESVHEGTVSRWLKQVGDAVKEDEPIVEIMTDKVNTELPSPATGVLKQILVPEGSPVEVFHPMGVIEQAGTDAQAASNGAPAKVEPLATKQEAPGILLPPPQSKTQTEERRWFSPVVRSIAKQSGMSEETLRSIPGTGERGRVTKRDLELYLTVKPATLPQAASKTIAGKDQDILPLIGMRKMIADAMTRSAQIPTVSTLTEVDVTAMVKFRERNKDSFAEQHGVKLTYTPFFIKAVTEALLEFSLVNASLQPDNNVLVNKAVHMGIAVSLGSKGDEGLIVPVIRSCETKSLIEIARDLEAVASKARGNTLGIAEVQGGTFTITNPGSYGALLGTPMINAPQAAILGTYAIRKAPLIIDDMIAIRSVMNLVLTYDHRLIDGLLAGRFLQSVKKKLEGFEFFK